MTRRVVLLLATMVAGLVMVGGVAMAAQIDCEKNPMRWHPRR